MQITYPTELRYQLEYESYHSDSLPDQGDGPYEEHGTLRMILADECWELSYEGDIGSPGCEGCGKPAMWENIPDDPGATGYSGLCWCTACWFEGETA